MDQSKACVSEKADDGLSELELVRVEARGSDEPTTLVLQSLQIGKVTVASQLEPISSNLVMELPVVNELNQVVSLGIVNSDSLRPVVECGLVQILGRTLCIP